jgi:phosphohistidine phosphatase
MTAHRRLTLLRHAKAQPPRDGQPDRARELSSRGESDAPAMARRLRETGARPSLIVTSPAARALQTARLFATEIGYPLEFLQREADLYLATPDEILAVLARQDDAFRNIIVCGHNPGLTELANRLTGAGIDNVPTCGVVVIDSAAATWREFSRGAVLARFDFPKAVADAAQITSRSRTGDTGPADR